MQTKNQSASQKSIVNLPTERAGHLDNIANKGGEFSSALIRQILQSLTEQPQTNPYITDEISISMLRKCKNAMSVSKQARNIALASLFILPFQRCLIGQSQQLSHPLWGSLVVGYIISTMETEIRFSLGCVHALIYPSKKNKQLTHLITLIKQQHLSTVCILQDH